MFIAALFTIAKTWEWLKHPSSEERIKRIYKEYYSAINQNKIMSFTTTWVDWESAILSEVSQRQKKAYDFIHM